MCRDMCECVYTTAATCIDVLYLNRLAHPHTFPYVGKHFFLVLTERNTCVFIPP